MRQLLGLNAEYRVSRLLGRAVVSLKDEGSCSQVGGKTEARGASNTSVPMEAGNVFFDDEIEDKVIVSQLSMAE